VTIELQLSRLHRVIDLPFCALVAQAALGAPQLRRSHLAFSRLRAVLASHGWLSRWLLSIAYAPSEGVQEKADHDDS
jgi:hypothetical protein